VKPRPASHSARHQARRAALQALYQWQVAKQELSEIEDQFLTEQDMRRVDVSYFAELLHGVPAELARLDGALQPLLDRPVAEVDPVERAILRLGAYELACRPEVPYRVAINEAVDLAKTFGADQGHRYVNGVLDRLARSLRADEVRSRQSGPARRDPVK
jgi:N utilization substance protein B